MTSGERRFSERLEDKLEADYLCWFNVPVGPKQLQHDFIVLHPGRGFLALEVKDCKLDTIRAADRSTVSLLTDTGLTKAINPMLQARGYAMEVSGALRRDRALVNPEDHRHAGALCMPFGWGVVLANITRKQFEAADLGEVLDPHRVICQDEMAPSVPMEQFQERLWGMFYVVFPCLLSLPQIDRVRAHLFPELRLPSDGQAALFPPEPGSAGAASDLPELVRIMDMEQERLARSLGEGHRVIHGVAGSGKTMILGYRSVHLARTLEKPILVLCYNVSLAARLEQLIAERGLQHRVSVKTFHAWCRHILISYNVDLPTESGQAFFDGLVTRVIDGVEKGRIPRGQYGAVLIDEGHDFAAEWLKLVAQMVDPETNSLLVLYDDAQSIYSKGKAKFTFASVGIQAKGRTKVLQMNYRNTYELLSVARQFAAELLESREADEDGIPVVSPSSSGRRGPLPELIRCPELKAEAAYIAERVRKEIGRGVQPDRIAVIYPHWKVEDAVSAALDAQGVAYCSTKTADGKKRLFSDQKQVKLVTLESSKGLEFAVALIPGLGMLPEAEKEEADEARRLYVGMTRAVESLVMTYSQESVFTERILRAINDVQGSLRPQ